MRNKKPTGCHCIVTLIIFAMGYAARAGGRWDWLKFNFLDKGERGKLFLVTYLIFRSREPWSQVVREDQLLCHKNIFSNFTIPHRLSRCKWIGAYPPPLRVGLNSMSRLLILLVGGVSSGLFLFRLCTVLFYGFIL